MHSLNHTEREQINSESAPPSPSSEGNYLAGLGFAGLALFGNGAVSAIRKVLSNRGIGTAQQVGLACLIQVDSAFLQACSLLTPCPVHVQHVVHGSISGISTERSSMTPGHCRHLVLPPFRRH
eukprot:2176692-Rhodomonas_salina.1